MATGTINVNNKVILNTPITIAVDAQNHEVVAVPTNHVYRIDLTVIGDGGSYDQSVIASFGSSTTTVVTFTWIYTNLVCKILIMGKNWNISRNDGQTSSDNIRINKIVQIA